MIADEWVWLARIRRPQGRKGEVFAEILTDFPEKFAERRRLWLRAEDSAVPGSRALPVTNYGSGPRQVSLTAFWLHKGGIVLHFSGVDSISEAEALTGLIVAIPRIERVELPKDQAYVADLIGCSIVDVSGAAPVSVGRIEDVDLNSGPVAMLIVRGLAGEVLIPFAKSYLRNIDLESKRVEMALPEGLVDLNAPQRTGKA
jgi:16S rRNA processing protein RimM